MNIDDFDYHLPQEKIAQYPIKKRDQARLLFLRKDGKITHHFFYQLVDILRPGDLLVFNDSKVIKARLYGKKDTGGKVEILLVDNREGNLWECIGRGRIRPEMIVDFGPVSGRVMEKNGNRYLIEFEGDPEELGEIPLPPYIRRPVQDADEVYYQNVFAREKGSVAAATAGLHFTVDLLAGLKENDIDHTMITCHIRPGIFSKVRKIAEHQMEPEEFKISKESLRKMKNAKRLVAVGTSVVRVLENFGSDGITAGTGEVVSFIRPGFEFQKISGMITNFHLPKSPPMIMVSALVGLDNIKKAYRAALDQGYRFLSYGDGMLIIRN